MMQPEAAERIAAWLRSRSDCEVEDGLSERELDRAEHRLAITIQPLWRAVLRRAHPVSFPVSPRDPDGVLRHTTFPDWRLRDEAATRRWIEAPVDGILDSIELWGFWWHDWGPAPAALSDRIALARARLAEVPRLTPLWGNLHVASDDASPVWSIHLSDVIVHQTSLAHIADGADDTHVSIEDYPIGSVPFWSLLSAWNQIGHLSTRFDELADQGPFH